MIKSRLLANNIAAIYFSNVHSMKISTRYLKSTNIVNKFNLSLTNNNLIVKNKNVCTFSFTHFNFESKIVFVPLISHFIVPNNLCLFSASSDKKFQTSTVHTVQSSSIHYLLNFIMLTQLQLLAVDFQLTRKKFLATKKYSKKLSLMIVSCHYFCEMYFFSCQYP